MINENNIKTTTPAEPGLGIRVTCQPKSYSFQHGRGIEHKAYTVGGLYNDEADAKIAEPATKKPTTSRYAMGVLGENPTADQRNTLGSVLQSLPAALCKEFRVTSLDDRLLAFHDAVAKAKHVLSNSASKNNGIIPEAMMKSIDSRLAPYNLQGYLVKVTAIKITRNNPTGSRKRADGLFETSQVVRTIYINRPLTEVELERILTYIGNVLAKTSSTEFNVIVGYKEQKDKQGNTRFIPFRSSVAKAQPINNSGAVQRPVPPGVKK